MYNVMGHTYNVKYYHNRTFINERKLMEEQVTFNWATWKIDTCSVRTIIVIVIISVCMHSEVYGALCVCLSVYICWTIAE